MITCKPFAKYSLTSILLKKKTNKSYSRGGGACSLKPIALILRTESINCVNIIQTIGRHLGICRYIQMYVKNRVRGERRELFHFLLAFSFNYYLQRLLLV